MKRKELEKMSREQIIELVMEQDAEIEELRGYPSGLDKNKLKIFDTETMIDLYLRTKKVFGV